MIPNNNAEFQMATTVTNKDLENLSEEKLNELLTEMIADSNNDYDQLRAINKSVLKMEAKLELIKMNREMEIKDLYIAQSLTDATTVNKNALKLHEDAVREAYVEMESEYANFDKAKHAQLSVLRVKFEELNKEKEDTEAKCGPLCKEINK